MGHVFACPIVMVKIVEMTVVEILAVPVWQGPVMLRENANARQIALTKNVGMMDVAALVVLVQRAEGINLAARLAVAHLFLMDNVIAMVIPRMCAELAVAHACLPARVQAMYAPHQPLQRAVHQHLAGRLAAARQSPLETVIAAVIP